MKRFLYLPNILIILGIVFLGLAFGPLIKDEVWFYFMQIKSQKYELGEGEEESVFAKILTSDTIRIRPQNRDFSLVIEKIGVNAPIVYDVSTQNEEVYRAALKKGIAHAASTDYPSEKPGNVFLFAHASLNFWDLGKYATAFNLLKKLELGDKVHVFFRNRDFLYEVMNKQVVKGWEITPLTRSSIEPLLTLQTCDPPGTTLNRLVVTAKLVNVK